MKVKKAALVAEEPPRDAKVIDLMERLRQSLDASSGRGRRRGATSSPRAKMAHATTRRSTRSSGSRPRSSQRRRAS
jgi:non-homologous end joining protein Ku